MSNLGALVDAEAGLAQARKALAKGPVLTLQVAGPGHVPPRSGTRMVDAGRRTPALTSTPGRDPRRPATDSDELYPPLNNLRVELISNDTSKPYAVYPQPDGVGGQAGQQRACVA